MFFVIRWVIMIHFTILISYDCVEVFVFICISIVERFNIELISMRFVGGGVMSVFSMVRMAWTRSWSSRSARWVEEYGRNCWWRFEVVQSPRCCVFDALLPHSWNRGRCSTSHRLVTTALVDSGWDEEDRKSSRNALLSGYYHNSGVRMQEDWFLSGLLLHD